MNVRRPSSPFHRTPPPPPPRGRGYDYNPEPEPEPEPDPEPPKFSWWEHSVEVCREFNEMRAKQKADEKARWEKRNADCKELLRFPPKKFLGWITYITLAAIIVLWTCMAIKDYNQRRMFPPAPQSEEE